MGQREYTGTIGADVVVDDDAGVVSVELQLGDLLDLLTYRTFDAIRFSPAGIDSAVQAELVADDAQRVRQWLDDNATATATVQLVTSGQDRPPAATSGDLTP